MKEVSNVNKLVVNIRAGTPCDVYVGRGASTFGNPYSSKKSKYNTIHVGSTDEALRLYQEWLTSDLEVPNWPKPTLAQIQQLRGKQLGCYCRPPEGFLGRVLCHAQILAAIANGLRPEEIT